MPSARPTGDARSGWHDLAVLAIVTAVVVLAFFAVMVVAVAVTLSQGFKFEHKERAHLQPIPIDPASCAYVDDMHRAANQFQRSYPLLGFTEDARGYLRPWTETQWRLAAAADVLDYSITASVDHFPTQVQWYLTAARDDLRAGRMQLPAVRDGFDFVMRMTDLYAHGEQAFGYAGDLIGSQCQVPLGADTY